MDLGLEGATAVVQGGTQGMGRAAAECFAADGAKVAVLARTQADLDVTVAGLLERRRGRRRRPAGRHHRRRPQVDAAFAEIGERWDGSLNILVNATGSGAGGGFDDMTDAEWSELIDLGAMGMVRCVRSALPLLRAAEWARIVNVSAHSTKRQTPSPHRLHRGQGRWSRASPRTSRQTLAPGGDPGEHGLPGKLRHRELQGMGPQRGHRRRRPRTRACGGSTSTSVIPRELPRAGDPAEIGPVIAFLASKRNTYMTGANVNVDGGSDFC